MSRQPLVSVIVPHYNDLASLALCIETLERQTYPAARTEIIVADNASPQGEVALAETLGDRARLVIVAEKGAGPARNGGVAAARGEVLAFIDCDCQAEPDWLASGVAALSQYDLVGGRVEVLVDDPQRLTGPEAFEKVFAFDNETYVRKKGFTVTANLFCAREVFARVGGFRVGVSEDMDWCWRASAAGFRLGYTQAAAVGHPARRSWSQLEAKWRRLNRETFGILVERPGGRIRWLIRSLMLPLSAVIHSPKVLTSRKLRTMGQRMQALGALYRLRTWRLVDSIGLLVVKES